MSGSCTRTLVLLLLALISSARVYDAVDDNEEDYPNWNEAEFVVDLEIEALENEGVLISEDRIIKKKKTPADRTKKLLEEKRKEIEAKVGNFEQLSQFKDYAQSEESFDLFQWELLNRLVEKGESLDLSDKAVAWIYNDKDTLEALVTSGDIIENNWERALSVLSAIVKEDPDAKQGLKSKIAVAVALTFSVDVISTANKTAIDGIARYHNFAKWADQGILLEPFYNLNTFEMREVVHGNAQDDELVWARKNVTEDPKLKKFADSERIGKAVFAMVKYTPGKPMGDKPPTLENMHIYGGVCGTFCKFGAGVTEAFGIPASPIGQPGHCAFTWLKVDDDGSKQWQLANKVRGWDRSTISKKVPHYTWKKAAPFLILMWNVQQDPVSYRLSEKMRILTSIVDQRFKFALIEDATTICTQNYDLYRTLHGKITTPQTIDKDAMHLKMVPTVEAHLNQTTEDIAWLKPATSSSPYGRNDVITRPGRFWFTDDTDTAWIEIDLEGTFSIENVEMRWDKPSMGNLADYNISAEINGVFTKVRSKAEESKLDKRTSSLEGWDGITSKVRLEMKLTEDIKVCKHKGLNYTIGINEISVFGKEYRIRKIVSLSRPVRSNVGNKDKNLVDGDSKTSWKSKVDPSWIEISFSGICVLEKVTIDWVKGIQGSQTVKYVLGGETYKETSGQFEEVDMTGLATTLRIELSGSKKFTIREISASGFCLSTQDILKMRVEQGVKDPRSTEGLFVIQDIWQVIDGIHCDTCF